MDSQIVLYDDSPDPLAVVTNPPPNETAAEKAAREEREAEAQRISDQIDDQLRSERAAFMKEQQMVKILLLGQSGSGKFISTHMGVYRFPGSSRPLTDCYPCQQGNLLSSSVSDAP